jgi:hypothetical protein
VQFGRHDVPRFKTTVLPTLLQYSAKVVITIIITVLLLSALSKWCRATGMIPVYNEV